MTVEPVEPVYSPSSNIDWAMRKAFQVNLEAFAEERAKADKSTPPTVGELYEFVLAELQRRLSPDGPAVDRVRERLRAALASMHGRSLNDVDLGTPLEELFPLEGRAKQWRVLQTKLTGLFVPPLDFPAGDVYFGAVFWITIKLGLLIFGLAACCVAAPVAAIIAWLVILVLELRYAVRFPERAKTGDDLAVYIAELKYGEYAAHISEIDEASVWDAYQIALAKSAAAPEDSITPSKLLQDVWR